MARTPAARGPYAKTAGVRDAIIDACTEVFAQTGYRATTMKDIARRAGISEGGLAHHFASKADLLTAVLQRREAQAALHVADRRGMDALIAMIDIVTEDAQRPGIVELHSILSTEATSTEHPAHDHYRDRYDGLRAFATSIFEVLQREGEIESSLSPGELAASYLALSDGLQVQWLYDRAAIDPGALLFRFLCSVIPRLASS